MTAEEKSNLALELIMRVAEKNEVLDPWEKWQIRHDISSSDLDGRIYDAVGLVASRFYEKGEKATYRDVEVSILNCGFSAAQAEAILGILYATDMHPEFYQSLGEDLPYAVKGYFKEVDKYLDR